LPTVQRDTTQLTRDSYDVLVVGGGIHGLFAAYDAAARGFRTALVDRGDIGSGVSANHQRTIHGGLRALQSGDLRKTRAQILERRTWARIAPHLIRPLPFLFGTYRSLKRSRLAVRAGLKFYDYLGRHRNDGVTPELHLPKGRLESAAATKRLFAGISEAGLTGGAMWYDYQTAQAERLTWAVAAAAHQAGATLANYVNVTGPNAGQSGVHAVDLVTGTRFEIHAKVIVLAAAEGLGALNAAFGLGQAPPLLRAMNLLLDRPAMDMAHVAPTASGRMLTAVPWRGFLLVGTSQSEDVVAAGTRASDEEIAAFLDEANTAFARLKATPADIRLVQQGLVPAVDVKGDLDLIPDFDVRYDTARPNIVTLIGAKYTTARLAAERAIDQASRTLGHTGRRCSTASRPLPHAEIADVEGQLIETARGLGITLDLGLQRHLASWYGTEAADVLRFAMLSPWKTETVADESPVLCAEIAYARRYLMAQMPDDAIYRRTALGGTGRVPPEVVERATAIFTTPEP
jgi:glycerol-3-phosphate dehydrogenase